MSPILDGAVASGKREESSGVGLLRGQSGDAIDGFLEQLTRPQDKGLALEDKGLLRARPIGEIGKIQAGAQVALLDTSMAFIGRSCHIRDELLAPGSANSSCMSTCSLG